MVTYCNSTMLQLPVTAQATQVFNGFPHSGQTASLDFDSAFNMDEFYHGKLWKAG